MRLLALILFATCISFGQTPAPLDVQSSFDASGNTSTTTPSASCSGTAVGGFIEVHALTGTTFSITSSPSAAWNPVSSSPTDAFSTNAIYAAPLGSGGSYTFTATATGGTAPYLAIIARCFSNINQAMTPGSTNQASGQGTTAQFGAVTSSLNDLIISGEVQAFNATASIDSGFNTPDCSYNTAGSVGGCMSYKISTGSSENPSWTALGSTHGGTNVVFAANSGPPPATPHRRILN